MLYEGRDGFDRTNRWYCLDEQFEDRSRVNGIRAQYQSGIKIYKKGMRVYVIRRQERVKQYRGKSVLSS
jgi:hypothetical protein